MAAIILPRQRTPIIKVSSNGRFEGCYPGGNKPANLAGSLISASSATGILTSVGGGNAWATEGWESKTLNAAPNGTFTDIGGASWDDNFYTYVRNDRAKAGSRSLSFEYGAYEGSISEQRFHMNRNKTDVWAKYDVFVPAGYRPANPTGAGNSFTGGNKIFVLFSDGYSSNYPTMIVGAWYKQNGPGSGNGNFYHNSSMRWMNPSGVQARNDFPWDTGIDLDDLPPLIYGATDLGTWMRHIVHFKMATGPTAGNGVWEFWVTRANGTTDKLIDIHNGQWYGANPNSTGGNYMNGGYLLGAAGTLWPADFTMNVDEFVLSDTNLWGVS